MDYEKLKEILRERLNEKRYNHSLCVADEARRLAEKYGADKDKAYLAGLLHDITINAAASEQLLFFSQFGIMLDEITQNREQLWHAGAAYIENVLKINDSELLSAVRYHTTAKAGMTTLEKVLYLADFTSLDRDYSDVDVMREKVEISMECAMEYALSYTINELIEKRSQIHPDTMDAYNEIMKRG